MIKAGKNMTIDDMKTRILTTLQKERGPLPYVQLQEKARLQQEADFAKAMAELKYEDKISVDDKQMVSLVFGDIRARVSSLSKGFAFVRPEEGFGDIFVHGSNLKNAMLNDIVILTNITESDRGRSGEVKEIVEEGSRYTTGTLVYNEGYWEFAADIPIRYNLQVNRNTLNGAQIGDKVYAHITRNPKNNKLVANIVKVFGKASSARVCADAIVEQNGIRMAFPEEVLEEARQIAARGVTQEDMQGRIDLRDEAIFTIDSASAKDLDDAISCKKTEHGFELGVHIADVSHYVKEGSAMDKEAQLRGTSVYFADRVIPMLPPEISNGVCSLTPDSDKLAFSAIIQVDMDGAITGYRFEKTVIRTKVRGIYSEVNEIFKGTATQDLLDKYKPVMKGLMTAREMASITKERSRRNGTMELESNEPKFILNENGICIDVQPRQTGESEQMIEQLMVTANQAAAKLAEKEHLPFVYRVHENPKSLKIETLIELVSSLGLDFSGIKKENPSTAEFAAILDQAVGTPAQKIVSYQILRTMEKARYATDPLGHFGLALADYCHYTSPIRRYPDTAIHRILTAFVNKKGRNYINEHYATYAQDSATNSSEAEVKALVAERSAEDCYMAEYMTQHIGEQFDGIISGVTNRGLFVQLTNSVEGFVPIDTFVDSEFEFDGMMTQVDRLTGDKLTIGMPIRIQVVAADVSSGRIDFMPASEVGKITKENK